MIGLYIHEANFPKKITLQKCMMDEKIHMKYVYQAKNAYLCS